MPEFEHAEAYCLMTYACDRGHREVIWNSRDGVTPFVVGGCRTCGREMTHVDWRNDVCNPTYQPQPGERMFVTMTPEDATQLAREMVEKYWTDPRTPMSETFADRDEAVKRLAQQYCEPPGQPRLVTMGGEVANGLE